MHSTRLDSYLQAALDGTIADLDRAPIGGRNAALNAASYTLGRLVGAGVLDAGDARAHLASAASRLGVEPHEARATITSGLRAGQRRPRRLPDELEDERRGLAPLARPPRPVEALPEPLPNYLPREDVRDFWRACVRVTADAEVCAYLEHRGLDADEIDRLDLARAMPVDTCPSWAVHRIDGHVCTWAESGHRLVVPLYDHVGEPRSVIGRSVKCLGLTIDGKHACHPKDYRKSTTRGARKGLVMANPIAWIALAQGTGPVGRRDERLLVFVMEGEIDFLLRACVDHDGDRWGTQPAVFALFEGGWSQSIADRLPADACVLVETHADAAGDKYAERVLATLGDREAHRVRWEASEPRSDVTEAA